MRPLNRRLMSAGELGACLSQQKTEFYAKVHTYAHFSYVNSILLDTEVAETESGPRLDCILSFRRSSHHVSAGTSMPFLSFSRTFLCVTFLGLNH